MSKKTLSIFTEKTNALGGFDYTVTRKLLGNPSNVDDLSLFVREVAQNTWDARLNPDEKKGACLDISVGTFADANSKALESEVFNAEPETEDLRTALVAATRRGSPYVIVRDSKTVGLAGATEADEKSARRNFISFVRNIGQDTHDAQSGGCFGFGKSVFFRYSEHATILAYTRTTDVKGKGVSRLIGMSLHKSNRDHTGRHWWGVPPNDGREGFNQPLSGEAADKLAESIGFSAYGKDEMGTSIMVISPTFPKHSRATFSDLASSDNRELLAGAFAEALLIWYWPRMLGSGAKDGELLCSVHCDGRKIAIPNPAQRTPLNLYAIAFGEIQKAIANPKHTPDPQVTLKYIKKGTNEGYGYLAVFKNTKVERADWLTQQITPYHPFAGSLWPHNGNSASCRSAALIRSAGQVVRYLETVASPLPSNEYGAVFYLHPTGSNADETLSEIKASEPASHDDWSPVSSTVARYLVNRIRGEVQALIAPNIHATEGGGSRLGKVSIMLGGLWGDGEAAGGGGSPSSGSNSSGKTASSKAEWSCSLAVINGEPCVVITILPKTKIPEDCESLSIETKARAFGGAAMRLDNDVDSGAADVLNDADEEAGKLLGWYATDPRKAAPVPISKDQMLSVESITPEMRKNGFYAVVRNASTFGLSLEVRLNIDAS